MTKGKDSGILLSESLDRQLACGRGWFVESVQGVGLGMLNDPTEHLPVGRGNARRVEVAHVSLIGVVDAPRAEQILYEAEVVAFPHPDNTVKRLLLPHRARLFRWGSEVIVAIFSTKQRNQPWKAHPRELGGFRLQPRYFLGKL